MAINVSVQFNGGETFCYYHRGFQPFKCHEEVLSLQPMIPPKRFDVLPLTGGCSEDLGAFRFFFKQRVLQDYNSQYYCTTTASTNVLQQQKYLCTTTASTTVLLQQVLLYYNNKYYCTTTASTTVLQQQVLLYYNSKYYCTTTSNTTVLQQPILLYYNKNYYTTTSTTVLQQKVLLYYKRKY